MSALVVAAVAEELGDLPGVSVGVGPVRAGVAAANALAERRPERVVLVGTVGRYPGGPPIGAVVEAGELGWADAGAERALGYVPLPPPPLLAAPLPGVPLPRVRVLTLAAITTDVALAARFGEAWAVEHLESYAVALACAAAGVPFHAVLAVTNDVGPAAHAQWLRHRDAAQDAARDVVRQWLAGRSAEADRFRPPPDPGPR